MQISCPYCKANTVIKKGKRKTTYAAEQRYHCKNCGRRFITKDMKHTTYPPQVIYATLNIYDLGYSLSEVSRQINKTYKIHTSKSTIHTWIQKFQEFCPIAPTRQRFSHYDTVLFKTRFAHENLDYEFMYHRYKLDVLTRERFPGLFHYITRFEHGCPDVFFETGERCSHPHVETQVVPQKKMNLACRMARFACHTT